MSWTAALILALIVGVPVAVLLEGKRQRRRLEAMGEKVGPLRGGDVVGAGMLHLQGLLQADRRMEVLRKEEEAHPQPADPGGDKPPQS